MKKIALPLLISLTIQGCVSVEKIDTPTSIDKDFKQCEMYRDELTTNNLGFFTTDAYMSSKKMEDILSSLQKFSPQEVTQGTQDNVVCIDFTTELGFANILLVPRKNGIIVDYVTATGNGEKYGFQKLAKQIEQLEKHI